MKTPFDLYDAFKISILEDSIDNAILHFDGFMKTFNLEKEKINEVDFSSVCPEETIPYNSNEIRFLLYEPLSNPGTTIFFPNFTDGWHTAVCNYVQTNKKNAYQVGFHLNDQFNYPAYYFNYMFWKNRKFNERIIQAIKEERNWNYFSEGVPLYIEDTNNYIKRKIKDRVNNNIILDYMLKANYNLKDDSFYTSKKIILYKSRTKK